MDVFFLEKYGKLYEKIENGQLGNFKFSSEHGSIKYLFLKRPVPWLLKGIQYFDTITPYGYGGPYIVESDNKDLLLMEFELAWRDYCRNGNVIAEFVRFHLFDNIDIRERFYGDVRYVSQNVVVDTQIDESTTWMNFDHKVRKNVNKAKRNGLMVKFDEKGCLIKEFLKIYYETMDRNDASKYYYFKEDYFRNICKELKGNFMFFHTMLGSQVISTELVLCSANYCYSFLGGTVSEYKDLRPNDLLKYEIINWCRKSGRKAFVLGGGYHKDDGIYRYKKAFAPNGNVPFYVGKCILNQEVYETLTLLRAQYQDFNPNSEYFPIYRE
jgi:Uncharacterized protein involved in methicillin resistance